MSSGWNRKTSCLTISVADSRHSTRGRLAALIMLGLAVLWALAGCSRAPDSVTLNGSTMGTVWTVRLATLPPELDVAELRSGIEQLLETVNAEMSTYRDDSVITAFNLASPGEVINIPPGFGTVLSEALYWAEATDGAFDPTAGPLVSLWGFGPERAVELPPSLERLEAARARVGWEQLDFESEQNLLQQPGSVHLDLSAIAKGWAVDLVTEHLLSLGLDGFLVDIGGDLRVQGRRPDGGPWRIAIERPVPGVRESQQVLELSSIALATSGDYRNFFEMDGRRLSHLIDPRSGWPIDHATVSVTVAADSCLRADVLATALSVLEFEHAWELALTQNLAVFWLLANGELLDERMTPAFQRLIESGEN